MYFDLFDMYFDMFFDMFLDMYFDMQVSIYTDMYMNMYFNIYFAIFFHMYFVIVGGPSTHHQSLAYLADANGPPDGRLPQSRSYHDYHADEKPGRNGSPPVIPEQNRYF